MYTAGKDTQRINQFVSVAIPRARDLFRRYGEVKSSGSYLTTSDEQAEILGVQSATVIDQMINSQKAIEASIAKSSK